MKLRTTIIALAAALMATGCAGDRSQVLKVYDWADYIDEDAIGEFEQWYKEQTGENVKVIYQTFDINETMLSKIEKGHEDYDVVCPSDYIIERMLKSDLIIPIDRDFGKTPNYIDGNISPFIKSNFDKMDGDGKNANDYAVGYMWGTTGILYNTKYVTDEEASTWDILRNPKFKDKIFVKDSPRDVYSQLVIFLNQKQIADSTVTMDQLMRYTGDENIEAVKNYMEQVKEQVAGWEADFGKEQMTQERAWANMTWSGDAMWAIQEAKEVGVDLKYTCPKEGFTVWFDGWVIPKYAKNVKAARYWIDFLCRPDIAIRNMNVTGYVSAIGAPEVMEAFKDENFEPIDISYFFGPDATSVCVDPMYYAAASDIERSTVEHDWGDDTAKLISMWSEVKGSSANTGTAIIIAACVIALLAFGIMKKVGFSKRNRKSKKRR